MYQIIAGGSVIYSPGGIDEKYVVMSPKYEQDLNRAGQVTFSVIPGNQCYNSIDRLTTPISVYRDNEEIFFGRILEIETNFYREKEVICEGALAFLNDVIIRPFVYTNSSETCVEKYVRYILNLYNTACGNEDWKKIYCGDVTVTDSNNYIRREKDTYNTALSVLMDHTVESTLGGYLSTRRSGGKTYLDYTVNSGEVSDQSVMYGRNLLDLSEKIDASDVFTILIPVGKDGLTIESVNDGKDYLESELGIQTHGRIWAVRKYDDITTASGLKTRALKDLAVGIKETVSLQLSAVDLSEIGIDTGVLKCGDYIPVFSAPHSIDSLLICNHTSIELDDPTESTYTLGATILRLTDVVNK